MNTKRLFALLLVLLFVFTLIPAQEAYAYKPGDVCPRCRRGSLYIYSFNDLEHEFSCRNQNCELYVAGDEFHIREPHYVGTAATCASQAICGACGARYGGPDPDAHDWDAEWSYDANEHYHKCVRDGCPGTKDEAPHYGGTATCVSGPICEKCGHEYGSPDPDAHDWDTEWSYDENGHYHKCLRDGCTARKDEAAHYGGTATCMSGPICEGCRQEYGSPAFDAHDWGGWEYLSDTQHQRICQRNGCGAMDAAAHDKVKIVIQDYLEHALRCGTCSSVFKYEPHSFENWQDNGDGKCHGCCVCGHPDTQRHDFSVDVPAKDPTCTEPGYTDHKACSRCGAKDGSYREIPAGHLWDTEWSYGENGHYHKCLRDGCTARKDEAAHAGGTATCTEKAVCTTCGQEYGAVLSHNWDPEWSYDANGHYHKCLRDGCTARKDEAAHAGGTATCTEKAKCETCGQPYGTVDTVNGHSWDAEWSHDENGHYHKCLRDGCTARKDEAAHAGGTATCVAKAICSVCQQPYGTVDTVNGHDWVTDEAVAPTCTETGLTEGKHCSRCPAKVAQEVVPAKGHTPGEPVRENEQAPTCTEEGHYDEVVYCAVCKAELSRGTKAEPALGHDYHRSDRTLLRVTYTCSRCHRHRWEDNVRDENREEGLLLDEAGAPLSYTSAVTRPEGRLVLTLTPETVEGAACLMLRADEAAQWQTQGLQAVVLAYGDGQLTIDLNEMGPGWFANLENIDAYAFTLAPAEGGLSVQVEALTGEARTEAETLSGLTLALGEATLPVTANGVYTFAA